MAASGQDEETCDGETFIEKYTRGVLAVETILTLDRKRQSVAVKELINAKSKHLLPMGGSGGTAAQVNNSPFMRKTVSVPNISHVSFRWIAPLRSNTNVGSANWLGVLLTKRITLLTIPCFFKEKKLQYLITVNVKSK